MEGGKRMRKHFLDLFAGLGGASEAFVEDVDNWSVLRIDNNPILSGVQNMVIDDVFNLPYNYHTNYPPMYRVFGEKMTIDCIWASPPCREFSGGYNSPKSKASRELGGLDSYEPDMSLLERALIIIDIVKPKYWIIENVKGSIKYFEQYLGKPRQIIGPYVLWGNFPYLDVDQSTIKTKASKDVHSGNPLRANIKAKVDIAISQALKNAIENQTSIFQY